MYKFKILIGLLFVAFLFLITTDKAIASEGTAELRSTVNQTTRCYASSLLMEDNAYTILVSCRDLIYPAEQNVTYYVLWAQPTDGSNPVNLGYVGYGKITVRMGQPFSSLFVTTESNPGSVPAGRVVMRGNVTSISFLERPGQITPSPTGEQIKEEGEQVQQEETPT